MTPIHVEGRKDPVERDLVTSTRGAAARLVGGIRGDSVDPRAERRVSAKRVDLSHDAPERVLHCFLGILLVAGDADRQAICAVAERGDQTLGGGGVSSTQGF